MRDRVIKLLQTNKIEKINPELVDQIKSDSDYLLLEQVLKNGHQAETVIQFLNAFRNKASVMDTPEYKALQKGLTVAQALQINSETAFKALGILGNDKADLAAKFQHDNQIQVLHKVYMHNGQGKNKNKLDPSDALLLTNANDIVWEALSLGLTAKQALSVEGNPDTLSVLKVLIDKKGNNSGQYDSYITDAKEIAKCAGMINYNIDVICAVLRQVLDNRHSTEMVKKFIEPIKNKNKNILTSPEYKALQKGLTVENALKINNPCAFQALEKLGNAKVDEAAKFNTSYQITALEKRLSVEEALQIKDSKDLLEALKRNSVFESYIRPCCPSSPLFVALATTTIVGVTLLATSATPAVIIGASVLGGGAAWKVASIMSGSLPNSHPSL